MSYKIASFNMCKFHENINNKELIKIASAINNEKIDILAIQEIFSKGALDNLLAALGSEWEGCWDSPNSRSPSAAEGYAFAWRKNNIGLTKNREGKVFKPTILNQYKMHKELYLKLLEKSTKLDPANAINFQKKLIRNPYYGRFSPADLPGGTYFEFRIINTHIMWSLNREENEKEDKDVSLIPSDVVMRKNEYNILTNAVYPKVSKKDIDYLMGQTNSKYMPAYTILVGDYNLNLDAYPRIHEPVVELNEGIKTTYNPSGTMRIETFQDKKTTLKSKDKLYLDPNDEIQVMLLAGKNDEAYFANNYDHFTYDTNSLDAINVKRVYRLDCIESMFPEYRMNDDPYKVYREYRDSVSDHLPIVIELEIRK